MAVSRNPKGTKAKTPNTSIEPGQMSAPKMDRPSIALAWFLDSMVVEGPAATDDTAIYLVCNLCGESVCEVETGDTLRVLINTGLAHTCP